jgi:hypothetical protein
VRLELAGEEKRVNEQISAAANNLAEATDSDVILYSGGINRPYDDKLLDLLAATKRRRNVILFLCSRGGNPDAAYRMARGLQDNYERFTVVLAGHCKSAGTLLVLGANQVVMTAHAELGPLDVQIGKKDELFQLDSGLTVLDALTELEGKAFELFEKAMIRIKVKSEGAVTFKTATHIATELAKGVIAPIMAQIDPMHVGEVSRALKIGKEYGARLSFKSENLLDGSLDALVEGYPSHGFVIDRSEASDLFIHVRDVEPLEAELIKLQPVRSAVRMPSNDDPIVSFLSEQRKEVANDSHNAQNCEQGVNAAGTGNTPNEADLGSEESQRLRAIS